MFAKNLKLIPDKEKGAKGGKRTRKARIAKKKCSENKVPNLLSHPQVQKPR